jgi:hypothetical protein
VARARLARTVLTLAGGALMVASAFLNWLAHGPKGSGIPIQFLWSPAERETPGFFASVGFVAIVLGLVAVLGLALRTGLLTSLAGALAVGVFVLCLLTLYRVEWASLGIGDVGIGAWLLLVGGVLGLVGGFLGPQPAAMPTRQARAAL